MNDTALRYIINFVSMAAEIVIILLLFRNVPEKKESRTKWIGYAFFVLLALFYFSPVKISQTTSEISVQNFTEQVLRAIVHFAIIWVVLCFIKEAGIAVNAYLAAFYSVVYLAVQNIRILMVLLCMFYKVTWDYQFWFRLAVIPMEILMAFIVYRFVHFEKITQPGITRWITACLGIFLQLYIKWSLLTMQKVIGETARWESSAVYSFFAIASIVALLILFEVNLFNRAEKSRLEMEKIRTDYEMQGARRSMQTNEEIRRLYHDMKNHLTAIRAMEDNSGQAKEYINSLLEQFEGFESDIHTGNVVTDSVLSEKVQRARRENIGFNICLDLKGLEKIAPADLVTIFGNALDNAIEAVMKLPSGIERIIYVKSTVFANYLAIRFSNQFTGELVQENGNLRTDKEDTSMHGIGIYSIRRSVEKNNGSLNISIENDTKWFRFMIMLPID